MKTLYIDCAMGCAGDMLTAALLELHPDREGFIRRMNAVLNGKAVVSAVADKKCGIVGTHVSVLINGEEEGEHEHHHHEHDHEHKHTHSTGTSKSMSRAAQLQRLMLSSQRRCPQMAGRKSDFTLPTLDELFTTQELRDDAKLSKIRDIPLELIDDFPGHPFKVRDDEDKM